MHTNHFGQWHLHRKHFTHRHNAHPTQQNMELYKTQPLTSASTQNQPISINLVFYHTMAYYEAPSFLAILLISNILLTTTCQAVAKRNILPKNSNTMQDKKEPQWFFNSDGGSHVPGIGRVGLPPLFGNSPQNPYTGGGGEGAGVVPAGHSYVPGDDDTFVTNPGFEVPNPGSGGGGGVPAAVHP